MDAFDRLSETMMQSIKSTADGVARGTAMHCAMLARITANGAENADYQRACYDIADEIDRTFRRDKASEADHA